ncbi:fibronectin type III domain-containing protein [Chryseobacterium sp. c4a]|uniref:fibronectin type III domain-containing protein n=1 Tax=Chryseobacterium sp. c4a TaxID=1573582 RepID=UPI001359D2C6|nr:fibronectin type III domain-containing protein [Chryseobacterium sp. c4a]
MSGLLLCKMSRPFKVLIALLCMVVGLSMQAQTITIGTGTLTQKYPLAVDYGFERSAAIYTAAEIAAAGGNAGSILSLGWNSTSASNIARPVKIYIKPVGTTTAMTAQNWGTLTAGATLLYSANTGLIPVGWYTVPLQIPFTYNGVDNLMVLVETNYGKTGTSTGAPKLTYSTVTNGHMYIQTDNNPPTTANGTVTNSRPDIQLTFGTPPSCLPMPPGGALTTGTVTATSAVLNWPAYVPAPAGGYDVYYNTTNVPPVSTTSPSLTVPGPTANIGPLLPSTTYYVWVRARCSASDQSVWSSQLIFATPATCPAMPNGGVITTGTITPNSAVINWPTFGYTPAEGFEIYYNTTGAAPNGSTPPSQTVPNGSATSATISPLLPDTTYYVWVRAKCSATDQSAWNVTPKSVVTPPTCLPVPSTGSFTVGSMTPTSAVVSWPASPSAPAGGYEVYYNTTGTPPVAGTPGNLVVPGTSAPLTPLVAGTTYYWWVRAVCTSSDRSSWVAGPSFSPGQIGTGTGNSSYLPIYAYYGYNYSQQIYTAAEVLGAVGNGKFITELKFYVNTAAAAAADQNKYNEWVVYMGNTTQNNFTGSASWVPYSSLKKVWEGTLPTMTDGTWITIPLTTPLLWDGTSNIVVAVDENSPSYTSDVTWGSFTATADRGLLYYNDSTNPDPASPPTSSLNRYKDIPKIRLKGIELLPCTGAPPSNIVVNNVTASTAVVTWLPSIGATYVIQYRPVSGGPWKTMNITTALASSAQLINLVDGTLYEVQIATICNGTQGAFSTSTQFSTPALTYCTNVPPVATPPTLPSGYISKVVVTPTNGPIMASSSGYDGYKDYSTDPTRLVTLVRGTNDNKISITKFFPGNSTSYGVGVWIDLNRNGIFETTERFVNGSSSTTTPVNTAGTGFNIALPPSAATYDGPLLTRMRVIMRNGDVTSPCGAFSGSGEVEDYAVRLIDQPVCSTAAPLNITVSNITDVSATFSWLAATGATYKLQYRKKTGPGNNWIPVNTIPAPGNSYTVPASSPLLEQTEYEVQVATICNGVTGPWSALITFKTLPLQYCVISGSGENDHISNVTVTSANLGTPPMINNSDQNYYTSYNTPATLITLDAGSSGNKISVGKAWNGATSNDAVAVWIDYNRNGQFETTERILGSAGSTVTPVTDVFTVPNVPNVYTDPYTTTMRVILKRSTAIPTACTNAADGEVEDYAVKIRPCSSLPPNAPTFTTITHTTAVVNLSGGVNTVTYLVRYRVNGTSTWTEVYASTVLGNIPLTLIGLSPATTYEVEVAAVCGGSTSTASPIVKFTTRCDPTPPTVTVSNITPTTALITWNPVVLSATYRMRWRKVGATAWEPVINLPAAPTNTYVLGNLESFVTYEVQVANKCDGEANFNDYSNSKVFTTERICEIPPPGLTITQLLPTSAEITWDPYPGATYLLRYRKVGIPSWTEVTTPVNTIILNGLVEMTKYEMQVVNICGGKPGNYTPPYYFTTPTVIYCKMKSENAASEYISKVTVIPNGKPKMENESKASSYTDYTGVTKAFIELVQGSTDNEIIIEKKWLSKSYNEGISVWIDFNRNGEFDINEKIFTSPPNTDTPVSGKFSVPADSFVSTTDYKYAVMRVAMERDGIPVNCVNVKNGEVEDYTVRISKQGVPNPINQTDILIYPNPVTTVLYVKNVSKRAKYKIYNAAGQVIVENILLNNEINVSKLINGVYVIDIDDNGNTAQKKFIKK